MGLRWRISCGMFWNQESAARGTDPTVLSKHPVSPPDGRLAGCPRGRRKIKIQVSDESPGGRHKIEKVR